MDLSPWRTLPVLGALGPLLALGHEVVGQDVVEHAVRIGRVRALAEDPQIVRVHVQREVRKDQVVIVVGELVVVQPRVVLALRGAMRALVLLHVARGCCVIGPS